MIDQMYLRKSAQYQSGENVEEGNLCKGIFALLIVELKQSIPFRCSNHFRSHIERTVAGRKN